MAASRISLMDSPNRQQNPYHHQQMGPPQPPTPPQPSSFDSINPFGAGGGGDPFSAGIAGVNDPFGAVSGGVALPQQQMHQQIAPMQPQAGMGQAMGRGGSTFDQFRSNPGLFSPTQMSPSAMNQQPFNSPF